MQNRDNEKSKALSYEIFLLIPGVNGDYSDGVEDKNENSDNGVVNADNNVSGGEECNRSEDNDLFHVHWCVCLCWRKAPLLHSLFSCVVSH